MKLSSTLLGAIAVAQADDHPGIFVNILKSSRIGNRTLAISLE